MRETEFWYWLQGYFELSNSTAALLGSQIECIVNHVMLVEVRSENLIAAATMIKLTKDGMLRAEDLTMKLSQLASVQFQHVIDPLAGGPKEQERLNAIHNGGHLNGNGRPLVARC